MRGYLKWSVNKTQLRGRNAYVNAMDNMPPPAPETAWAILSDC